MATRGDLAHRLEQRFPRLYASLFRPVEGSTALAVPLMIAFVVSVLCMWGFLALADEFPEHGALSRLDLAVETWFQSHSTTRGDRVFSIVSALGSPVLYALGVSVAAYFAYRRHWLRFLVWSVTVAGGSLIDWALKALFHRVRPPGASEFIHARSWSFPSGHSLNSLVDYTLLAFFILEYVEDSRARIAIRCSVAVIVAAVGFSRIYLGVHFVSDVTAGYLAGGLWVTASIMAYELARRRRSASGHRRQRT
jgi:undecaprenyl-diphosphatase